eukprot:6146679-Alexandrium_andersonii.AAC.1
MSASLVGSEMCIRDRFVHACSTCTRRSMRRGKNITGGRAGLQLWRHSSAMACRPRLATALRGSRSNSSARPRG